MKSRLIVLLIACLLLVAAAEAQAGVKMYAIIYKDGVINHWEKLFFISDSEGKQISYCQDFEKRMCICASEIEEIIYDNLDKLPDKRLTKGFSAPKAEEAKQPACATYGGYALPDDILEAAVTDSDQNSLSKEVLDRARKACRVNIEEGSKILNPKIKIKNYGIFEDNMGQLNLMIRIFVKSEAKTGAAECIITLNNDKSFQKVLVNFQD